MVEPVKMALLVFRFGFFSSEYEPPEVRGVKFDDQNLDQNLDHIKSPSFTDGSKALGHQNSVLESEQSRLRSLIMYWL